MSTYVHSTRLVLNLDYYYGLTTVTKVLYGIPLPPSQVHRLAHFGKKLGPSSISILVDDVSQLPAAIVFKEIAGFPLHVFIKVDTGYHRAGLSTDTENFRRLVQAVFSIESNETGFLAGFYSHAGHSYGGDSAISAMETLVAEIAGLEKAASEADSLRLSPSSGPQYILSVGASPTTTSIENLQGTADRPTAEKLNSIIQRVKRSYSLELHAGVYPFLDMQQLATHASPSTVADRQGTQAPISLSDIALSILVEVASVYSSREKPEALLAAGTLALGREPCKSYDGWGIVSDWGWKQTTSGRSGWKIGRISQEHSVLTEDMEINREEQTVLQVGQKLRIFPNHACVASAGFSWYLIVDSNSSKERQDNIVDVWVRCRGW